MFLSNCLQPSFAPLVLTAMVDDGSDVPISPIPGTSSNYGFPNGSGPDLDGMDQHSINAQFKDLRDIMSRGFADFGNHIKTISEAVRAVTSRITSVEQKMAMFTTLEQNVNTLTENVNSLTTRICHIESSRSARSWNSLGHSDGSTATGSHGPGLSDDNRNTRRRLDTPTSPDDEQARSAVLLRFPCEQYLGGVTGVVQ